MSIEPSWENVGCCTEGKAEDMLMTKDEREASPTNLKSETNRADDSFIVHQNCGYLD